MGNLSLLQDRAVISNPNMKSSNSKLDDVIKTCSYGVCTMLQAVQTCIHIPNVFFFFKVLGNLFGRWLLPIIKEASIPITPNLGEGVFTGKRAPCLKETSGFKLPNGHRWIMWSWAII